MNNNINIISVRIRRTRVLRNLTQQELANKAGIKQSILGEYEFCSIKNVNKITISKIANALGTNLEYLLDIDLPPYHIGDDYYVKKMLSRDIRRSLNEYDSLDDKTKQKVKENLDVLLKYA